MENFRSSKYPPAMYEPYHEWKNELKAWKHMSDLAANKHGAALLCSLKGYAKKTAQKIDIDKVITAEGWDLILVELDKLYEKDKSASKYSAFDQLIKFRRPADMGLNDYLRKFEILKNQCESFQTVLSDDLLAYCMLESANLSVDKKELVRATLTDMTTKEMREKLRRIFPEIQSTVSAQSSSLMPMVKEEPVFQCSDAGEYSGQSVNSVMYGNQQYPRGRGNLRRGQRRSNYNRRRGQGSSKQWSSANKSYPKFNPTDSNGDYLTCDHCNSICHFRDVCPDYKVYMESSRNNNSNSSKHDDKYI